MLSNDFQKHKYIDFSSKPNELCWCWTSMIFIVSQVVSLPLQLRYAYWITQLFPLSVNPMFEAVALIESRRLYQLHCFTSKSSILYLDFPNKIICFVQSVNSCFGLSYKEMTMWLMKHVGTGERVDEVEGHPDTFK